MPAHIRLIVTAGQLDGRGHLARALSLAEAAWAPGTTIELELIGDMLSDGERARAEAVDLRRVQAGETPGPSTVVVVDVPDPGVIVDRVDPARLAVFDDRDVFGGQACLVVQPSQATWSGAGEARFVLAGYDYVPISAAIRRQRSMAADGPVDGGRPRILVCFGGSDPAQVTARLVPALAMYLDADIEVIVGHSYHGATDDWPVQVRHDPPDLVERLATADVALLGAGTMKFEAACLARPMLLLAVADDQLPVGPAFAATRAARYLGDGRTVDPLTVVEALTELLAQPEARAELGAAAARVVDGDGADRIASAVARLCQPAERS